MPLDVMAGLPATGSGPPGLAALPEAGAPPGNAAAQFASMLAQQSQAVPVPTQTKNAVETASRDTAAKQGDTENVTDPQATATQAPPATAIDWAALAALQNPQPILTQQSLPTANPSVSGTTTRKEVMDTVSLCAPAISAQGNGASSGLLPLSMTSPVPPAVQPAANVPAALTASAASPGVVSTQRAASSEAVLPIVTPDANLLMLTDPSLIGTRLPAKSIDSVNGPAVLPTLGIPSTPDMSQATGVSPLLSASQMSSLIPASVASFSAVKTILPSVRLSQPDVTLADLTSDHLVSVNPAPPSVPVSSEQPAISTPIPVSQGQAPASAPAQALMSVTVEGSNLAVARESSVPSVAASAPATAFATPDVIPVGLPSLMQPSVFDGAMLPAKIPAQITLQNSALPANNTGMAQSPQGAPVSSPNDVGQTDTPVSFTAGPVSSPSQVVQPLERSVAKVATPPGNATGLGRIAVPDDAPKGADQWDGTEDDPSDDQSRDSQSQGNIGLTYPLPVSGPSVETQTSVTATTDKPLTGAERAQVVRQTADGISTVKPPATATGQGQMTVQLHPKEWGDLRVTVQMTPAPPIDGVKQTAIVAHVVASSPAVKAALETQSADLNQALRQTGLHLERLTVTVQAPGADAQSGSSTSGDRSSGSSGQDQWQSAQSQTGSGGLGAGSSSSFGSYSERQGGSAFQNPSTSLSIHAGGDGSDTDPLPVSDHMIKPRAGFDQRV